MMYSVTKLLAAVLPVVYLVFPINAEFYRIYLAIFTKVILAAVLVYFLRVLIVQGYTVALTSE